ncbi:MetQ/NlpA family ABC transporter substrate-binding protein [Radiobacillus kanasensis]|uniref:MetQ/NlpA family ABC transporter substrate-binding protein n=1 Tax=Radiobacillus kanasensis TaxID=2844358 RepID=UPI001E289D85|nr:MetQ/NlpA family ABC transporter substrate-binding protein [Radiobacillus kanasensis]UFT98929.1 MetQ/NlpA family ABC transporter substrate-binding protein [Radiobacillus kanasensis]
MKKLKLALLTVAILFLAACNSSQGKEADEVVKIGVTSADTPYWTLIKEKAEKQGIQLELVEFSDYIQPNNALANEEIDMNSFQHLAFLGPAIAENGYDLVPIASTVITPTGIYSEKYKDLSEVPSGGKVAISDDPANLGRGLLLLQKAGLIKLKEGVSIYPTPEDIVENPKNLEITTMVSQQTARVLPDVDISLINNGIAGQAGLNFKDALLYDDPESEEARPYINVFAVRAEDKDNETYKKIAELYQEPDVKEAVKEDSNGGNIVVDIAAEKLQETLDELVEHVKKSNQ